MSEVPGVPRMRPVPGRSRSMLASAVGLGMGAAAAGLTAAAGVAAERLSRDRRTAKDLDASLAYPRFHESPDREVEVEATDGVMLHVEIDEPRGEAPTGERVPTVVFSHGYCLQLASWVMQRRALREAGYRVVLWDQRGHGRSGMGGPDSISIEQLGDDLARVIAEVAPEGPLVLVGHSMGGMTMMALALEHEELVTERVIGAAFVATSPGDLSGVSYGLGRLGGQVVRRLLPLTSSRLAKRQEVVDLGLRYGRDLVDFFVDKGSFGSPVPLSVAQLTTDMIFGTRMEVIAAFFPLFDEHDKHDALAAYDGVDCLVISGTADRLTPPDHSEQIVRLLPGAEHVVVEDAGHVIMVEHPEILNSYLLDLLERVGRAERGAGLRTRTRVRDLSRRTTRYRRGNTHGNRR